MEYTKNEHVYRKSKYISLSFVFFIFIFMGLFTRSQCLYEDQIGKFDWHQMYVGSVKFAEFDMISTSKKMFVATDKNVIAALNLKSGHIIWRQVLEKKDLGIIHFMNLTSEAVITVSGIDPINVRSWDLNGGFLLWEWSIPQQNDKENINDSGWFLLDSESVLFHILRITQSHFHVTKYNFSTGEILSTSKVSLPLNADNSRCILSAPYIACTVLVGTNPTLHSYSLISDGDKFQSKSLPAVATVLPSIEFIHGDKPLVAVAISDVKYIFLLQEQGSKQLPYEVHSDTKLVQDSLLETNILLKIVHTKEWLEVVAVYLDSGEPLPEVAGIMRYPWDQNTLGPIKLSSAVCSTRKDKSVGCRVVLSTEDGAFVMLHYPGKLMWVREEALASIATVEMLDLPVSDKEAAIEKEFDHKETGFLGIFAHRLISQTLQLRLVILSILGLGDPPSASQRAGLVRDEFGLHKMIVVATEMGKLFGIDNLSGEIVWRRRLESMSCYSSQSKIILYVQRTARHFPHPAQCALIARHKDSGEAILFVFNPITGQSQLNSGQPLHLGYHILQTMLLPHPDENFLRGIILLDDKDQLHVYPESAKHVVTNTASSIFIFTADPLTGILAGYSLIFTTEQKLEASRVWEVKLNHGNQKLTAIVNKSPVERVHSQGRVLGDRSVLYKYINPNLVAVATQGFDPIHKYFLNLYLLDVVSGSIVFSISHKKAREPIHIVHSENWVLYSYYNDKARRTEVITLELYEGKSQSNTTAFSSVASPVQPIVDQQAYILPGNIVAMKETITEKGITSKHILVALANGGVLELPWVFVDPRRPITVTPEMREEGVIPYIPELPIPSESIINYNQSLQRVHGIHTAPSGLESTCLVLVYGLDLYYTRVAPSKTFDVLKEDFDHFLITAVLLGLTLVSYITRKLASRKALKQAWK